MTNLISMTDFVLEQYKIKSMFRYKAKQTSDRIEKYANFLKKPLELGMFVPCDEDGNVLEDPEVDNYPFGDKEMGSYRADLKRYQQAKERCLFDGFEIKDSLLTNKKNILIINHLSDKTIEHIVNNEIELTQTAIKQISL